MTIVFGEADPRDYWEPLCDCGHMQSDHEGCGIQDFFPCWHGWSVDDKRGDGAGGDGPRGCECVQFVKQGERP